MEGVGKRQSVLKAECQQGVSPIVIVGICLELVAVITFWNQIVSAVPPVTDTPVPNNAWACVPESALIVILLLVPVEVDVIFKKFPSTTIEAPAIVIPPAALATSVKSAPNTMATSDPSTITVKVSSALVAKSYAANASPVNVPEEVAPITTSTPLSKVTTEVVVITILVIPTPFNAVLRVPVADP